MDRFSWSDKVYYPGEEVIRTQKGVSLRDGDEKSGFETGTVTLTSHRLLWEGAENTKYVLSLALMQIIDVAEQSKLLTKSTKIICHLSPAPSGKPTGPVEFTRWNHIILSFRDGGNTEFYRSLNEQRSQRKWEQVSAYVPSKTATTSATPSAASKATPPVIATRAGIVGIERKIKEKHEETGANISVAFEDLNNLMKQAKDMVGVAKKITTKIKDKQGELTDDETVQLKSYLLSMGIDDPVTRDQFKSDSLYHQNLAKEMSSILEDVLKKNGGMMTLTDCFCRINRARGLELISPQDLLNASKCLESLNLPVRLKVFDSGVHVLQLRYLDEAEAIGRTGDVVEATGSLSAEGLATLEGMSVILAKERLLLAEKTGVLCRDDSAEGLRFYPNLFLRNA